MYKELVVAPCIDLFASHRHHQLSRYYSAYEDDPEVMVTEPPGEPERDKRTSMMETPEDVDVPEEPEAL